MAEEGVVVPATPVQQFSWEDGRLAVLDPGASSAVRAIAELISDERFGEAMARIEGMTRSDVAVAQIGLAMAVAGHPSCPNPESALESITKRIDRVLAGALDDPSLQEFARQIEVYQVAAELEAAGLLRVQQARALCVRGRTAEALGQLASASTNPKSAVLERVALAGVLEDAEASDAVLKSATETLKGALKTEPDDPSLDRASRLLQRHAANAKSPLAVDSDDLMYPQLLMRRIRALYWGMEQAGAALPDVRQALNSALADIRVTFPNHDLARMYSGERVPWGKELAGVPILLGPLSPLPPGAPRWAAAMRELRARVDYVEAWWFRNRQGPGGALSGDWAKDCAVLPDWGVTTVCCGHCDIEAGIRRVLDGAWSAACGGDSSEREQASAPMANTVRIATSVGAAISYGDATLLERLFDHVRRTAEDYTAVNGRGHLHFKGLPQTAEHAAIEGTELLPCGEFMQPVALLAWYSEMQSVVAVLHDWALAWSEDATRLGLQKPGGVFPASVRFSDDSIDGTNGRWWDPGLGEAYVWGVPEQAGVVSKTLAAWRLTGDARLLDGIRGELDLFERYHNDLERSLTPNGAPADLAVSEDDEGSPVWAARRIWQSAHAIIGPYRAATADRRFDRLAWALLPSYARFTISGAPSDIETALLADLEVMRANLPLLTSEAPGPDRVPVASGSLLGPLTGATTPISEPPSWAVTWSEVNHEFAALVRMFDTRRVSAWAYSFAETDVQPQVHFWRLEPGRYELRVGKDANADGVMDGQPIQTTGFEYARRRDGVYFNLPPRVLCLVEAAMVERPAATLPQEAAYRPDLAVLPRDVVLGDSLRKGLPCRANVIIHNIGGADALDVTARMTVFLGDWPNGGVTVGSVQCGTLAFPGDLKPKQTLVTFEWIPDSAGTYGVELAVSCSNGESEIDLFNNRFVQDVMVAE